MNVALIMGRAGSVGVPGKNVHPVHGLPLAAYPMKAAIAARRVDRIYVTTDCPEIKRWASWYGLRVIDRPEHLARPESEMSEGIVHAVDVIEQLEGERPAIMVSMLANCGTHAEGLIDRCIERLEADPAADSCVSGVFEYSLHPYRVKRVRGRWLKNWVDVPEDVGNNRQLIADRAFVLDGAARAFRVDRCLPPLGQPPFRYLGHQILYEENPGGFDVHSEDDLRRIERYIEGRAASC
jgi:N-acylneuraminate cytidylyltransferase